MTNHAVEYNPQPCGQRYGQVVWLLGMSCQKPVQDGHYLRSLQMQREGNRL